MSLLNITDKELLKTGPYTDYITSAYYYVMGKKDLHWHLYSSQRKYSVTLCEEKHRQRYKNLSEKSITDHIIEVLKKGKVIIWVVDDKHEDGGYNEEIDIIAIAPVPEDFDPTKFRDERIENPLLPPTWRA